MRFPIRPRAAAILLVLCLLTLTGAATARTQEDLSSEIGPYRQDAEDGEIHAESSTYSPENIPVIYDFLINELGLNTAAACGVLANIHKESSFDPTAIGDAGAAYGICQWNSRRVALINYCQNNGYGDWTSLSGQLHYMQYELENSKKSTYTYLKAVTNDAAGAYNAAYYFCYHFEIPANRVTSSETRGALAVTTYWEGMYGGKVARYTVTFDANGGKNAPAAQTKTEGVPMTIPANAPTRDGHAFAGWAQEKNAIEGTFEAGGKYTSEADITLYAVWVATGEAESGLVSAVTLSGHRYELYDCACTWEYAKNFAAEKGGYLATVTSDAEFQAISSLIVPFGDACWVGGYFLNGNWLWTTGEAFNDALFENMNAWSWGEPNSGYGYTGTEIYLAQTTAGTWSDYPAASTYVKGFIVEYGAVQTLSFPVYKVNVSSSLRLRNGPGTSYAIVGTMYNGTQITILETAKNGSTTWGYGKTNDGQSGWCAMVIPDYVVLLSGSASMFDYVYEVTGGESRVIGYTGAASSVTLPDNFEGAPLTQIGEDAFAGNQTLTSIALPDGVKTVSSGAFADCAALAKLAVPGSVIDIARDALPPGAAIEGRVATYAHAFAIQNGISFIDAGGSNCASVKIKSTTVYLDMTTALSATTLPKDEPLTWTCQSENLLLSYDGTATGRIKGTATVRATAGSGAYAEAQIEVVGMAITKLPDDTEIIGKNAFLGNTSLRALDAGNSALRVIENGAFAGCDGLVLIILPASVTSVGDNALPKNENLVIQCPADSWICRWASEHGFTTQTE